MPSLFARRLFDMMANEKGIRINSQNESVHGAAAEDGGEDTLEKIVEKKRFVEVLMKIYFGTPDEKINLVYEM